LLTTLGLNFQKDDQLSTRIQYKIYASDIKTSDRIQISFIEYLRKTGRLVTPEGDYIKGNKLVKCSIDDMSSGAQEGYHIGNVINMITHITVGQIYYTVSVLMNI
jgi:hypothetical protein